jgi:hypothetical protein
MLESRKREFIYTRKEVLLDDEERKWEKNCRQSRYESLIKKNRSKFKPGG